MKRWLILMGAVFALTACSANEEAVVEEVEASETDSVDTAGKYYLEETHPAIVEIGVEYENLRNELTDSLTAIDYEEEYVLAKLMEMIIGYKELSVQIDALPVEGLDADREQLEEFKVNAKLANDTRVLFGETLVDGLGRRGISREALDMAKEYSILANEYSLKSTENVIQYEEKKGYDW